MRTTALAVILLCIAGCGSPKSDDRGVDDPIPVSAYTPSVGRVVVNEPVTPEAAGAGSRRHLVIAGDVADDRALLAELEVATVRDGWKAVACVTKYERCFKRNGYFVSMVAVSDSRKPGVPGAYLSLRRTAPAMVAASVAQS